MKILLSFHSAHYIFCVHFRTNRYLPLYSITHFVLLTVHPCIIIFKWSQLGAHCFSVYVFQLLYTFRANVCPSSEELNHLNDRRMWRVWVRRWGFIGSWWGNRREGNHWGDLGVDGWIILGWISRSWDVGIWTGLGWPRIETFGGRLWVR